MPTLNVANILNLAAKAGESALSVIAPRRCVFCGVPSIAGENCVCQNCHADLPWIVHSCQTCGVALPTDVGSGVRCAECQVTPSPFAAVVAPLSYEFPVDAAIKRFKFHRGMYFAPAFVELMLCAANKLPADIDALLPVPLHPFRHMRRGYNQATELAAPLAKAFELPVLTNVRRVAATPPQSGLTAAERRQNLRHAFAVRGSCPARHVVIVDDVVTTGATCQQLARELRKAGVKQVSVLAIARA